MSMPVVLQVCFWVTAGLIAYTYVGYPCLIWALARSRRLATSAGTELPGVSLIIPAHNESANIVAKVRNVLALDYPKALLEVIWVSDGSTDDTANLIRSTAGADAIVVELTGRGGKAAALNTGLARSSHDIVAFSDASILLEGRALRRLVAPFEDPRVGCVSGEDVIPGGGGEALYGRYELFLRRQESSVSSIVGASGCFYAQRRDLCGQFLPGVAPDFLSVLRTIEAGSRAVSEPGARGSMAAVARIGDEFQRKVRTLLRGITTLAMFPQLLSPRRHGLYAMQLASHKLMRWLVPFFLAVALLTNILLAPASWLFTALLGVQLAFYVLAALAWAGVGPVARSLPGKAALYLVVTNVAALVAWVKFAAGVRQELWNPSERSRSAESLK
jgi:cellulose synthase/poly-beta-1,6-N-acetylglucosamine synthase-like glycosyltransferase